MKEKTEVILDDADRQILNLLAQNARLQWQEIGEKVHLTGQGVRNRINRLEKAGVLKGYTIQIDHKKLGKRMTVFVAVFMKTINHKEFIQFVQQCESVTEAHKTGGEACYLLKVCAESEIQLTQILDEVQKYGNYKVSLSLKQLKGNI